MIEDCKRLKVVVDLLKLDTASEEYAIECALLKKLIKINNHTSMRQRKQERNNKALASIIADQVNEIVALKHLHQIALISKDNEMQKLKIQYEHQMLNIKTSRTAMV